MNKIDTYDLEKQQHEFLLLNRYGRLSEDDLLEAYIESNAKAVEYKKMLGALDQSLVKNTDPAFANKVREEAGRYIDEYDYRYISEEEMKTLKDYGYTSPIALVRTLEMAVEYMDNNYPVFLLNKDGTETVAKMGIDVERHLNNGGLVGVSPFSKMDMNMKMIYGELELDRYSKE